MFFEDCQEIQDKSGINCILEQIAQTDIDYPIDIALYCIEHHDHDLQKLFDSLFKPAVIKKEDDGALIGEIKGDGIILSSSPVITQGMIDQLIDTKSTKK